MIRKKVASPETRCIAAEATPFQSGLQESTCPGAYCDYTKPTVNQSCDMAHPHNRGITEQNFWWCFNPMETIALYTQNSGLPAPPFNLEIKNGHCVMPSGV